jgi:hypothetical protein
MYFVNKNAKCIVLLKAPYIELIFPRKNKKLKAIFYRLLTKFPNSTALRMFPVFERNLHESHVESQFVSRSKNTRRVGYET